MATSLPGVTWTSMVQRTFSVTACPRRFPAFVDRLSGSHHVSHHFGKESQGQGIVCVVKVDDQIGEARSLNLFYGSGAFLRGSRDDGLPELLFAHLLRLVTLDLRCHFLIVLSNDDGTQSCHRDLSGVSAGRTAVPLQCVHRGLQALRVAPSDVA